jgi:hypothetical protein
VDRGVEPAHALLQPHRTIDQLAQALRQQQDGFGVAGVGTRQLDLGFFLVGLGERHLALIDGAMEQKPRGKLHQPRGQPHALGRVGERGIAFQDLGFTPSGTVQIAGGLLNQRHALAEQSGKRLRAGQARPERDRPHLVGRLV